MRRVFVVLLAWWVGCQLGGPALAKDFKLIEGSVISGDVSSFDDSGVIFRLKAGGFTQRVAWSRFTQEALKELAETPKLRPMVEPFIEIPPEARVKPKPKPIVLKEVARVERPPGRFTILSSLTSPAGLILLALLYAANLLAGYEVATYRNRPVTMVCGVSALLPLLGPLVFLASPTLGEEGPAVEGGEGAEGALDQAAPAVAGAGAPGGTTSRRLGAPPPPSGLRVAAVAKTAAAGPGEAKVYNRNEYTINRRFVETQFSGFFRVVPLESEKDLVVAFRTPKKEYVAKRISRISSNDVFLQLLEGGGTKEVSVGFGEIVQIIVRHKDDENGE